MANIIAHASGDAPGLQVFWIDCPFLSFPELLGKVDFSVFTRLHDTTIRCEFPKANIKKCLKMLKAVCGPSLTCLDLDLFLIDDAPPLEPRYFAQALRQIGETCPNLIEFSIGIPDPKQHSVTPIMAALNSMRFPKLNFLDIFYGGETRTPAGLEVDWDQFLLNHPTVESLKYCSHSKAIPSNAFPHLRKFETTFEYRTALPLGTYRLLSSFVVCLVFASDRYTVSELRGVLQEMPNLRSFTLQEHDWCNAWGYHGLTNYEFLCLIRACPKLIYLECHISRLCLLEQIYAYISSIPLAYRAPSPDSNIQRRPMGLIQSERDKMESLNKLQSLDVIELDIYGWFYEIEATEPPPWNGVLSFQMVEKNGGRELEMTEFLDFI
ncbi:hypothetical protein BT96DRAFT_932581 [Gymnopus androsaceus JB14]|uniref:F-box domain-containing protein n=1 Tax=Gymnopus androsaceus JB14 TaxID=1447944 RepID=A0A6A4IGE4_9AGAR|nr:hypothetical protein BT96DRAFT_932581 [Gymnopus androsaceus JB14]